MDIFRRKKFDEAIFAKNRTLAIRVGQYQSSDIKEASFDYGYIKGDTYKPGGTCAGSAKIVFTSIITTFNKLDKIYPEIGLLVDGIYEWVKMGEYFINDIEIDRNRKTTKLDLMDGMFKLNREHVTDLTYPAEIRHVIKEICLKTGVKLANENMDITSMNYRIESIPKEKKMTFRDVLSLATQMLGMSCFFNREGKLEIKELTDSGIVITADSYFMHGLTKSEVEYQIAGITCKKDKETLTVGMRTGRSLELDNLFMSQAILDNLYHKIKDIRYYPFNLNYQGHLLLNIGEWVTIKTNTGETFKTPVLSQSFTFKGGLRCRISADSKAGNDAQYSYAGTLTKKIVQFNEFEAQIQNQIEEADKDFDRKVAKIKKDFSDQVELARAKAEEVKRELSDTINQRFDSFDNGPLQEIKRKAIEALQNAGASTLLAQEAKRIGLDSIAKLEEFKRQATSAQMTLSSDLDVLKRTIANDIRPKQAQAEAEIAKQVEALIQTKNELASVKSAQATYEETTTRRLAELTNLANGKASKSELTQTAEELASKIASVQASGRNLFLNSLFKKDISKTGIWTTSTYEATIDSTDKYLGHNALKIIGQNPAGRDGGNPKITYPAFGQFGKVISGSTTNQDVTISFYAKASKSGIMLRSRLGNINYKTGNVILSTEIKRYVVYIPKGWTNESKLTTNEWLFNFNQEGTVWIWMPKFEISDVDTSYSEAPEDIEGQISAVESNFKQRADALDAGVSRLTEGLRTKADISALNVTAENIRQSVKSLETSTQNKLNQMLSLAEFEVRAGSIRQEILNATKDKADKTLVIAEAGKIREEFSNLRVGGRNLIRNYDWNGLLPLQKLGTDWKFERIADENAKSGYSLKATCTQGGAGGFYKHLFDLRANEFQGKDMTWSWDMKSSRSITFNVMGFEAGGLKRNVPVSTEWTRITNTFKVAFKELFSCVFYSFEWKVGDVVYIRDPQLEEGTIATTPKRAPEDTDGLITEAKATFERTAQGLRTELSAIQEYVNKDGQRQEVLRRYTREESARQVNAVRELVNRDFVGKATYQEDVKGLERRFEGITNPQNGKIATQIANYKQSVDGRFAEITSMISGKASQADFQRVQETSRLYERILGNTDNGIADNVARMAMTNQLFQVEVGKYGSDGINRALNTSKGWTSFITIASPAGINLNADLHKVVASGLVAGDKLHVCLEISIDDVQPITGKTATAVLQSWGDVKKWNSGNPFGYRLGNLIAGNNWRKIEYDVTLTEQMLGNNFWWLNVRVDGASRYKVHTKLLKIEKGSRATPWSPAPEDTEEAVRTVQSQLAGSWAVQNLTSAGALVSGLNLGANGHNRLDGKLTHITGETLIDKAVIKSAMVDKLKTANFEAGSVTTVVLDAEAVTAEKLKVDQAFFNKLVANEAYLSQLFAKQAFINRVQSVAIDASQVRSGILSGDRIYGGTIRGASIYGGTLTGHTQIQLGSYGSFDTVNGGLQINVPRDYNAKDGLGVQFIGSYGRGENVPYGLFIYKDSDFTTGGYASQSDEFLLTVEGYIKANGIGWMRTGKGSVNGQTTATIGLWNSENVSLDFGGSGNDIYYSYNGTAYSLWSVVNQHFSDRRLKENIVDCKHKALDYIQQFQFKEYDWKKQEDRPQQAHTKIGLIAQEVQTVDPTLVYENGDTLNLDNLRLTNIALKAIQELALENRKLTQRLENLENERRTA